MNKKRKFFISITIIIICIVSYMIIGYQSSQPNRENYDLPTSQLRNKQWDEIFNIDSSIDNFKILNTGSVRVPLEGMLNTEKLKNNHGLNESLWVDVFSFIFHHKEKGWFMIDTGLDSTFQEKGNINGILANSFIKETKQKKHQNIASLIKKEDIKINGIFFTHLHGDHTAGLPEIDPSIPKIAGEGETIFNIPFLYRSNHLDNMDTLLEIDNNIGITILPLESVIDIFGDGSLLGINTPGHSPSHLSYLINTNEGPILLTGDASHTKYGFNNKIEPGWVEDKKLAENSLQQLIKFHEKYPEVRIIYGHEQ